MIVAIAVIILIVSFILAIVGTIQKRVNETYSFKNDNEMKRKYELGGKMQIIGLVFIGVSLLVIGWGAYKQGED